VAEEFAGGGVDDAHVHVGDEEDDGGSGVFVAQADVVEAAVVAQGDASGLVDAVVADPPVGVAAAFAGGGFGAGGVGDLDPVWWTRGFGCQGLKVAANSTGVR
jgi:hypothetical protein